jgi:hypothetical protein
VETYSATVKRKKKTMNVNLEEGKVSIVRKGGVSVACPAGMSKLELGCVLQGLAGALIADELAGASNSNGDSNGNGRAAADPLNGDRFAGLRITEPQSPQGTDRRTKSDRRGLPRKKVAKRSKSGKREVLECGHVIDPVPSNWKKHKSRACEACAAVEV